MASTTTAWRLADARGRYAQCVLSDRDSRWQLVLWLGASIVGWEAHATPDAVNYRAGELWSILVRNGWHSTDERARSADAALEQYLRGCPECRAQAGVVTYRRHGYVVLFCQQCEHGWTDRERSALSACRDPSTLPHRDRRRVA
jgi:hypothetical protein